MLAVDLPLERLGRARQWNLQTANRNSTRRRSTLSCQTLALHLVLPAQILPGTVWTARLTVAVEIVDDGLNPFVLAIVNPGRFSVTSNEGILVMSFVGTPGRTTNNSP